MVAFLRVRLLKGHSHMLTVHRGACSNSESTINQLIKFSWAKKITIGIHLLSKAIKLAPFHRLRAVHAIQNW